MDKEGRIADIKVFPKAGILLDAIPALGDNFLRLLENNVQILYPKTPNPSPNPSPF